MEPAFQNHDKNNFVTLILYYLHADIYVETFFFNVNNFFSVKHKQMNKLKKKISRFKQSDVLVWTEQQLIIKISDDGGGNCKPTVPRNFK